MRILKIRFKNLNSLAGEWEIDLTHPAFASDGIFAITGPTGAGKTTILDAVCLALYGRTPRLNKVSKGWNEIMSRQTGDCFAEVTFETQAGRFRCHWSQHRAHRKPAGELQSPKHEIAHADSGRIFETSVRGVAEQIETATGMDFERFTRSMLLAQGGFAVFLQAAPDERAPILEQITGTAIYSLISMRVHERRAEERKKLETLWADLAGMPLLSLEDEQFLNAALEQKGREDVELNRKIAGKIQIVVWLDGIARLEQELTQVQGLKADWQRRNDAFVPELEKLQLAVKALELSAEYAGLQSLRREQESDLRNRGECLEKLPEREEAVKYAEAALKHSGEELEAKKAEQKAGLLDIRKARELDVKISAKDTPIKTTASWIAGQEKALEALCLKQREDCTALGNQKKAFEDVKKQLEATRTDESLVEHLAGIRERFDALAALHRQQKAKAEAIEAAGIRLSEIARIFNEGTESLETVKLSLESSQSGFDQKRLELKAILDGKELADWRQSMTKLEERKSLLDKAGETLQILTESKQWVADLDKGRDELAAGNAIISAQLKVELEKHVSLEREVSRLEERLTLLRKIQSLEEARHHLQDGEPCPLCGAAEHPYAVGNIPAPDETAALLIKAREDLKTASHAAAELKIKEAGTNKDLEQAAARQQEYADKIAASEMLLNRHCLSLAVDSTESDLAGKLHKLQVETAERLGSETRLVQAAEIMEKELGLLRESLDKTKESVVQAERDAQTAAHNEASAFQETARLKREGDALDTELKQSLSSLQLAVEVYGIENLSPEVIAQVQNELTARRALWLARQQEKAALEHRLAALDVQTRHQAEQIRLSDAEFANQRKLLGDLERERDLLIRQRHDLFGDKNTDDEESRLSEAVEAAEKRLEASRLAVTAVRQELDRQKTRSDELEKSIAARTIRLADKENAFLSRLIVLGFADEQSFVAAGMPENERKLLTDRAKALADEQTELSAAERDKSARLEDERRKRLTDHSRDELDRELEVLAANQKDLQQEIGGIRQKLGDNESLKQKQQESVQAIDAQKRECSRWDLLHELIGSADGKKYRNFAQGLTFEMMIGHANRQLQKMSDRYLLIRDDNQPLELNVIDNYQAGEIRSTKNLSGGESFVVSLALALGLSHMASKNVRVDSLFLDEGFGTLDEEALDTALETLAGLQQDGKLIGVISHVPALKERIGSQIQVMPQTGGRSVISGPGCGRLTAGADS